MIEEKKKVLYSNKPEFKKLVMQYAKKNIGRSITYDTFIKWLDKYGYDLSQYDTCWQAVFNRIRQKSPILYRWVMNAVRYEGYR
ncbi:hypothetical protein SJ937_06195, partial [Enterococcus faecium]